jgi:hypothetical protein
MRRKDDILWKGILEDVFDDFLRFFDPEAEQFYNFNKKFQFLDKELAQVFPPENDEYSPKVVDKLVKVFTRDGNEEWVLVHVEVQGQYQQDFARHLLAKQIAKTKIRGLMNFLRLHFNRSTTISKDKPVYSQNSCTVKGRYFCLSNDFLMAIINRCAAVFPLPVKTCTSFV